MDRSKHVQQSIVRRFIEQQAPAPMGCQRPVDEESDERLVRQYLTVAEYRRRQMLERILMR